MIAEEFKEVNVRIAEHQEEYETLPAYSNKEEGSLTFCFSLNKEELEQINKTGLIYFKQLTFNKPMNPVALSVLKEDLIVI